MTVADLPSNDRAGGFGWRRRPNFLLVVSIAAGLWLVAVPMAGLLLTAFTEDTGFGAFTLDNFVAAYSSDRILPLIGNSLVYAAGTAAVTFVFQIGEAVTLGLAPQKCIGLPG